MGIDVVQGPTQFRVEQAQVAAFEAVFAQQGLGDYWDVVKDESGAITGLDLQGLPGCPCEFAAMQALGPFVVSGSFVTLETAWGDDAWRWTFRKGGMTERTVRASARAA